MFLTSGFWFLSLFYYQNDIVVWLCQLSKFRSVSVFGNCNVFVFALHLGIYLHLFLMNLMFWLAFTVHDFSCIQTYFRFCL